MRATHQDGALPRGRSQSPLKINSYTPHLSIRPTHAECEPTIHRERHTETLHRRPLSQIVRFTIASKSLSLPMTLIPDPYHHTLAHVIDWQSLALALLVAFIVFSQHLSGDDRSTPMRPLSEARGDLRPSCSRRPTILTEAGRDLGAGRRVAVVRARGDHRARAPPGSRP